MKISLVASLFFAVTVAAADFSSHPPMRPLPGPADRPLPSTALRFVDAKRGADENEGSEAQPWRTLAHAFAHLQSGDTLVLRGGVYHGRSTLEIRASAEKPVTLRSYPGELAILDGGLPEFLLEPETAWEPYPEGADGEFVSSKTYPSQGERDGQTNLLGNFADSMIPLHGYRFVTDLRSPNDYFAATSGGKTEAEKHIYCGPGLWYNPETERIHVRLAHTHQTCLESTGDNYQGETDPGKLPLVVARGGGSTLSLKGAAHIVLQDLVIRGSREASLSLEDCSNITLEGVTAYGGSAALRVRSTGGLRCGNSAFRGIAAPWTWRGSLKYRAIEAKIIAASGWNPTARPNRDFEFANCEFTDCVDGVFIGNVTDVRIHHCLLDNLSDDGFFVTARTAYDGTTPGGGFHFYQNLLSRTLTTFAFGVGHGRQRTINEDGDKQLGKGIWIYRNVFDFRRPVHYQQPAEGESDILSYGRVAGDHGGPGWEPMYYYYNTFIDVDKPWRNYYGSGLTKAMGKGTSRRLYNNIFYQFTDTPGEVMPDATADFDANGNVHWSVDAGESGGASFLKRFQASVAYEQHGWTAKDRYVNPGFTSVPLDWRKPLDLAGSNIETGVKVPDDWPDPFESNEAGAVPGGVRPWPVGVDGRLNIFGAHRPAPEVDVELRPFVHKPTPPPSQKAAIVEGYPAFDAPLLEFALEKEGFAVTRFEKTWLSPDQYGDYQIVVLTGDFPRAKMEPARFSESDIPAVTRFLENGGTLIGTRGTIQQIFSAEDVRPVLDEWLGTVPRGSSFEPRILDPDHPWVRHLRGLENSPWLHARNASPLPMPRGENILGDASGRSLLGRVAVGDGEIITIGWHLGTAVPSGRKPSSVADEKRYEDQYRILEKVIQSSAR